MSRMIETLVTGFERGRLTRRQLIASLTAIVAGQQSASAQARSAPIAVRSLNHVSISVSDVDRSVDFYQKLFGMSVKSREGVQGNPVAGGGAGVGVVVNLAPGPGPEFIGIYHGNEKPSINHFCLGVQHFDAEGVLKTLTDRGVTARMRTRGESKEIFVVDPDNISVQLTDVSYCGGSGLRGNKCSG